MSNDGSVAMVNIHIIDTASASERTLYTRETGATEYGGKVF